MAERLRYTEKPRLIYYITGCVAQPEEHLSDMQAVSGSSPFASNKGEHGKMLEMSD